MTAGALGALALPLSGLTRTASAASTVEPVASYGGSFRKLDVIFREEVLAKNDWAWYVDHFTSEPWRYNVDYLSTRHHFLLWTNEDLNQRDGTPDTQWSSDEVAEWFAEGEVNYRHVITFEAGGVQRRLTLAPNHADIDGHTSGIWERYVEDGVRGALEPFLSSFERLESIDIYRI
jgi:hypothetical protein